MMMENLSTNDIPNNDLEPTQEKSKSMVPLTCTFCPATFWDYQERLDHLKFHDRNISEKIKEKQNGIAKVPEDTSDEIVVLETVKPIQDSKSTKLKKFSFIVNKYVGQFLRKASESESNAFQCILCSYIDCKKVIVLIHFLTVHSENEVSKQIQLHMDEFGLELIKIIENMKQGVVKEQNPKETPVENMKQDANTKQIPKEKIVENSFF